MKYKENNLSKNDINVLCSNIFLRTINEHESQWNIQRLKEFVFKIRALHLSTTLHCYVLSEINEDMGAVCSIITALLNLMDNQSPFTCCNLRTVSLRCMMWSFVLGWGYWSRFCSRRNSFRSKTDGALVPLSSASLSGLCNVMHLQKV